jgi:MFS family permease
MRNQSRECCGAQRAGFEVKSGVSGFSGQPERNDVTQRKLTTAVCINQYRDYNLFFTSFALALLGTGIAVVGIALLAFDLAGDNAGAALGTALAVKTATYVVVAPIAAVLFGTIPKRRLMLILLLVGALMIALLPLVRSVWQLYGLIFIFAAGSAVFNPMYQALVPHFLSESRAYSRALTKARVANELENAASPLAAAVLLLVLDHDGLFVAAMTIFMLAAAILSKVDIPSVNIGTKVMPLKEVGRGLRLFRDTPELRFMVPINMAMALIVAMVMTNTVVLVQGLFNLGERATAIGMSAFGVGVLVGAVAMVPLLLRLKAQLIMLLGAAFAAGLLLLGTQIVSFERLLLVWLLLGIGYGLAVTPASIILRNYGRAEDRGLLYATYFSLVNSALFLAYPLVGWSSVALHTNTEFVLLAAIAGVAVLAAAFHVARVQ